ncbi:N-terminal nucleophile aminohydrolase [Plenodomus tracheiphilus IPT5]|uniref:N-terminal nucleophile aminohydrolase n=1 Tax=Plenodomus tracheiphilus IPT5 TaxID=1408161 RepID=A0A6A7BLD1_9PLEO|nr:N-terminal nucleophile aminohydrolase [Plenodomus tracheiphilus IPT5]
MSVSNRQVTPTDGAFAGDTYTRKASRSPPNNDVCCIYVHAGAGYHSHQNERIHLEACNDAAQLAMLILRNGGTALDAVEAAIKTLEDREITNAGYGSNLAMDGVVECDASVIDHFGRSGAVGAVGQIKNPISLARMIHSHTMNALTLRRVPPNLLVAQGATDFAVEMGMPILPHDALVSPAAKDRWIRWRADLKTAERKSRKSGNHPSCWKLRDNVSPADEAAHERMREQHTRSLLQAHPNLLPSPGHSDELLCYDTGDDSTVTTEPSLPSSESWPIDEPKNTPGDLSQSLVASTTVPHTVMESSRSAFINSSQKVPTIGQFEGLQSIPDFLADNNMDNMRSEDAHRGAVHASSARKSWADGSGKESESFPTADTGKIDHWNGSLNTAVETPLPSTPNPETIGTPTPRGTTPQNRVRTTAPLPPRPAGPRPLQPEKEDHITDTVGAIAVDSWGNIACGASSGGIGMKYRGRVGPAALVGVGAAVIPVDPDDSERTCVATVTSGTGEHMATTMAATVCAERLYQSVKKGRGGEYIEVTEDEALRSMIENEFMGHVKYSNSAGAIGILGVKKMRAGMLLYYGHNTDSFAMASMCSDEDVPVCSMSRSNGNGQIAQGGRMLSTRRHKKPKAAPRRL